MLYYPGLPASVGYHRCRHRHCTPLLKAISKTQRLALAFVAPFLAGLTLITRKDNAHFPGDRSIVHTILLRRIVQRILNFNMGRVFITCYTAIRPSRGRAIIWDFRAI